jgi:hypothetical protein
VIDGLLMRVDRWLEAPATKEDSMFVFDDASPVRVNVDIVLKGGSFVLTLTPPSLEARTVDDAQSYEHYISAGQRSTEAFKARFFARLSAVTGWKGVNDAREEPLEFSQERLRALLGRHPAIIDQLGPHLAKLFMTDEAKVGESVASPGDSQRVATEDEASPSKPI